jgi:predicted ATP-grasp superfamily ATP-dependent carboligase
LPRSSDQRTVASTNIDFISFGKTLDTLVILGASITALAVARDAHSHGLSPIVVERGGGPAALCRYVRVLETDDRDDFAILELLGSVAGPRSAVISTSDNWLRFISRHRAHLDTAFAVVLHPRNDMLDICLNKGAFARWCKAVNLPTPLTHLGIRDGIVENARFPLLVRPANTMHNSRELGIPKAVQVFEQRELDDWLARYKEAAVEPLVSESLLGRDLEQISVSFARRESQSLFLTARKIRPAADRCAVGTCVELHPDPVAAGLANKAAHLLDYLGVGEMEILLDRTSNRHLVIEINARPWLQYGLAPASGHDFLGLLLDVPNRRTMPRVTEGKTWINLHDDLFSAFSRSVGEVRHGRTSAGAYFASLSKSNVFALLDWRDPAPAIASLLRKRA